MILFLFLQQILLQSNPTFEELFQKISSLEEKIISLEQNYNKPQTPDWLAYMVVLTAVGLVVTIIFNVITTRSAKRQQKNSTLMSICQELDEKLDAEPKLQSRIDCNIYAMTFLDKLERIAHILNQHDKSQLDYFDNYFKYGITVFEWYNRFIRNGEAENEEQIPSYLTFLQTNSLRLIKREEELLKEANLSPSDNNDDARRTNLQENLTNESKDDLGWAEFAKRCIERKFEAYSADTLPDIMLRYKELPVDNHALK